MSWPVPVSFRALLQSCHQPLPYIHAWKLSHLFRVISSSYLRKTCWAPSDRSSSSFITLLAHVRSHAASQSQTFQSVVSRMIHGMDSGSQARKPLLTSLEGTGPKSQMQESQCIKNSQRSQLEPSHILPAGRDVHSLLPKGIRGNSLQMGAQPRNYPLPSAATIAKQIK